MGNQAHAETGRPDGGQGEVLVDAAVAPGRTADYRGRVRDRRKQDETSVSHTHGLLRSSSESRHVWRKSFSPLAGVVLTRLCYTYILCDMPWSISPVPQRLLHTCNALRVN